MRNQAKVVCWRAASWTFITIVLLGLGLVMVASSSISIAERQLSEPLYYFWHQLSYSVIGLIAAFVIFKIPLDFLQKTGPVLIVISLVLLALVLIPGIEWETGLVRILKCLQIMLM